MSSSWWSEAATKAKQKCRCVASDDRGVLLVVIRLAVRLASEALEANMIMQVRGSEIAK